MILVILIDLLLVATLLYKSSQKGVENALPAFAFFTVLLPENCMIPIPGVFGLSAQRLAVVVLLICFFVFRRKSETASSPSSTPLLVLIFLQLGWSLLSTANSIVPLISFKKLFSVVFEYYVVYFIFFKVISNTETIRRIVTAMVAAMAITTVPGAIESYTGWRVTSWFPALGLRFELGLDEARGIRTQSTFQHSILYGSALAMILPLTFYLIATANSKLKRTFLWVSVLLMFLCLYKTSSRGPWIAAMLGFVLVFFYTLGPIKKYMLAIIALCLLVLVVRPGVYDTIAGFYDETVDPNNPMASSYQYRYSLRDVSVKAISKSPARELWGYGMESFYFLHLEGPFMGKEGHLFESCDSAWIEAMVETGFVGLGIFFLLLASAAVRGVRSLPSLPKPDRYLQWILVVNMLQYYFLMLSVAIYGWGQNGFVLWMTIAVSLAYPRVLPKTEASSTELSPAQPSLYSARSLVSNRS